MAARDPMTLFELMEKYKEAVPHFEEQAADVIRHHTGFTLAPGDDPLAIVREHGHAMVMGVGILNFLCWAFDEPTRGYTYTEDTRR